MKAYRKLFNLRQTSDYDDFAEVNEDQIVQLLKPAEQLIETIEKLINK